MTALSFHEKLFLELVFIILLVGVLETFIAPYVGFVKPAAGSGVMPLGLLVYGGVRYGLYKLFTPHEPSQNL
jgi:hypothetical protein